MDRYWLKNYPGHVPAEVDVAQYASVTQLLEASFAKYPRHKAFAYMDRDFTFADVDRYSAALGAFLQGLGLERSARVAIMMPNVIQYPICVAGILRGGYTVVNVNPLYTPRELLHQLTDSGAEAIIVLDMFCATLEQVVAQTAIRHVLVATMGEMLGVPKGIAVDFVARRVRKLVPPFSLPGHHRFKHALKGGARRGLRRVEQARTDLALLQYTGGTTGLSKGAMITHGNMVANLAQASAWVGDAAGVTPEDPDADQPVGLCALPLYHALALVLVCLFGMHTGRLSVLVANPRDLPGLMRVLRKYRFHVVNGIDTLLNAIAEHPDFRSIDFSRMRIVGTGGMAGKRAVSDKWRTVTGLAVSQGYGMTEVTAAATMDPLPAREFTDSVGMPIPGTEIAILDESDRPVPPGEPGEVAIRGPQVMAGYWRRPEETAKVMTPDGFLKSGDIGIMDERGFLRIVDRKKDMIIVSGFNVYPTEIEQVIATHPGVLECAAIGVPDDRSGEAVRLFVVRKDPALTEQELIGYCRDNLTGYKIPRQVAFRESLPKSPVGKILRRELREAASAMPHA
ncbi:MAG TPA: AMP-binding protein [Steroidobacteraceae bacterium]|nr:AMP-binding protein [Steroidobacteraceae bacterium]